MPRRRPIPVAPEVPDFPDVDMLPVAVSAAIGAARSLVHPSPDNPNMPLPSLEPRPVIKKGITLKRTPRERKAIAEPVPMDFWDADSIIDNAAGEDFDERITCPGCFKKCHNDLDLLPVRDHDWGLPKKKRRSADCVKCVYCSQGYYNSLRLQKQHAPTKSNGLFHCKFCDFSTAREASLEAHMEEHRTCPYCGIARKSIPALKKHMPRCHFLYLMDREVTRRDILRAGRERHSQPAPREGQSSFGRK